MENIIKSIRFAENLNLQLILFDIILLRFFANDIGFVQKPGTKLGKTLTKTIKKKISESYIFLHQET